MPEGFGTPAGFIILALVPFIVPFAVGARAAEMAQALGEARSRRRAFARHIAGARPLAGAAVGDLVVAAGRLGLAGPPLEGGALVRIRWAWRSRTCECWSGCTHPGARSLALDERTASFELDAGDAIVEVSEGFITTTDALPFWASLSDGEFVLRPGDSVRVIGRIEHERIESREYRGSRRRIRLGPTPGGCVVVNRA